MLVSALCSARVSFSDFQAAAGTFGSRFQRLYAPYTSQWNATHLIDIDAVLQYMNAPGIRVWTTLVPPPGGPCHFTVRDDPEAQHWTDVIYTPPCKEKPRGHYEPPTLGEYLDIVSKDKYSTRHAVPFDPAQFLGAGSPTRYGRAPATVNGKTLHFQRTDYGHELQHSTKGTLPYRCGIVSVAGGLGLDARQTEVLYDNVIFSLRHDPNIRVRFPDSLMQHD